MKRTLILLATLALSCPSLLSAADAPPRLKVLVLTGGHAYDTKTFPKLFDFADLEVTYVNLKADAVVFDDVSKFAHDVIVLYNMTQKITPKQQENFLALLDKGVGVIPFHHNFAAFQGWPEYQKIAGVKYVTTKGGSGYKHDVQMKVHVEDAKHPILAGVQDFTLHDETYIRQVFEADNHVLMTCDDPTSDKPVVWTRQYRKSRVCSIQLGHGPQAYTDASFRRLMHQAIYWTADKALPGAKAQGGPPVGFYGAAASAAALAAGEASFRDLLQAVAKYRFGQSRQPLKDAETAIHASAGKGERAEMRKALAELAGSASATIESRQWAMRQLGVVGTADEVGVLAAGLGQADLHFHARQALEACPAPQAAGALRAAMDRLKGRELAEVISSLAARGDGESLDKILSLIASDDAAVAQAATAAAGKLCQARPEALLAAVKKAELAGQASDSLLRVGDRLAGGGQAEQAAAIYQALLAAEARQVQSAALAGLVRTAGQSGRQALASWLASDSPDKQKSAVEVLGQLPADQASAVIGEQLPKAKSAAALAMLEILARRGEIRAAGAVAQAASSEDATVRLAALKALGRAGDESAVGVLLKAIQAADAEPAQAARSSLVDLAGGKVTEAIVGAMKSAQPAVRVELIRVLVSRNAGEAASAILAETKHPDAAVRAEALAALGKLSDPQALPALVGLLVEAREDPVRQSAAKAVETVALRIADSDQRTAPLLAGLAKADAAGKAALLRSLARLGGDKALAAVRSALKDADAGVQDAAVRSLADWTDAAAADDLLAMARGHEKEVYRVLALRALLRVIALPTDRSAEQTVKLYEEAWTAGRRAEDKKLVLAQLATFPHPRTLELAVACAGEKALTQEAATAAFRLAEALFPVDANAVKVSMDKLAGATEGEIAKKARQFVEDATKGVAVAANLAPLGKATSPDNIEKDGASHGDQAAIDGQAATYWDEEDGKKLYRLVVTFADGQTVSAISILGFQQNSYAPKDFEVLADGKSIKTVRDARYADNLLVVSLPPTACKSLELKITDSYGQSPAIRELGIYGRQETRVPQFQLKKMRQARLEDGRQIAIPQ